MTTLTPLWIASPIQYLFAGVQGGGGAGLLQRPRHQLPLRIAQGDVPPGVPHLPPQVPQAAGRVLLQSLCRAQGVDPDSRQVDVKVLDLEPLKQGFIH